MLALPPSPGADLPPMTVALCLAFAREARRIALGSIDDGDCLLWLLAQLTADQPDTDLSRATARLTCALLSSNGPLVWQLARQDGTIHWRASELDA